MVERLFLAVPRGCLRFVIVVFPDHTHLLVLVPFLIGNFLTKEEIAGCFALIMLLLFYEC